MSRPPLLARRGYVAVRQVCCYISLPPAFLRLFVLRTSAPFTVSADTGREDKAWLLEHSVVQEFAPLGAPDRSQARHVAAFPVRTSSSDFQMRRVRFRVP